MANVLLHPWFFDERGMRMVWLFPGEFFGLGMESYSTPVSPVVLTTPPLFEGLKNLPRPSGNA